MHILKVSMSTTFDGHTSRILAETVSLAESNSVTLLVIENAKQSPLVDAVRQLSPGVNIITIGMDDAMRGSVDLAQYDIVHAHDLLGISVIARAIKTATSKPKFVAGIHFNSAYGHIAQLPSSVDAVVCVSEHDADELSTANPTFAHKIHCIHSGINLDAYDQSPKPPNEKIKIGCYAGDKRRKAGDLVARVASYMPEYDFEIIGKQPYSSANIRYHDKMSDDKFKSWLSGLDIYLQPSRAESLGISILEAGASGVACIGSDIGGIKEIIENGVTGLLVPTDCIDEVIDAINLFAKDSEHRHRCANALRDHVATHFNVCDMMKKTFALYDQLVGAS